MAVRLVRRWGRRVLHGAPSFAAATTTFLLLLMLMMMVVVVMMRLGLQRRFLLLLLLLCGVFLDRNWVRHKGGFDVLRR